MTLPFRRRHHDAEGTHDRARILSSRRLLEPLDEDEATWLARHLEACTECRREDEAFAADHEQLRALRATPIEPPRDLWARTSAALDLEAGRRRPLTLRPGAPAPAGDRPNPAWRFAPAGALAAVAAVLVIVLGSVIPTITSPSQPSSTLGVANESGAPGPTPMELVASIPVIKSGADGSWDIYVTDVDQVCPPSLPGCAPPPGEHKVNVGSVRAKPSTLTLSPHSDQLVYEAAGDTAGAGRIIVVPVPSTATATPPPPTHPTETATPSATPTAPTQSPETAAPETAAPSPEETPVGAIEIASGVTIVGEAAYSPDDGQWLAFSAAPNDGSTGPDLYLYRAGAASATRVTEDHETYFSAWLGGQVLASRVVPSAPPAASGDPNATGEPAPTAAPTDGTSASFLLDPSSLAITEVSQGGVWLPVVDAGGRFVAYWSGGLRSADGGISWQLAEGQLVFDGWATATSAEPAASAATSAPSAEPSSPAVGPLGHAQPLVEGAVQDFRVKFDPDGMKLAVWVGEQVGESVGRLHLVVIDAATGAPEPDEALAGAPALRRFSIEANRLAWVTPPGQDGQESSLQVLGWNGDQFGEIKTQPAPELFIVR